MKIILTVLLVGGSLLAADTKPAAPTLTADQKFQLVELQRNLERAMRKVQDAQKEFQDAQAALVKKAQEIQPPGYQITEDPQGHLILVETPKEPPKEPAKKGDK